MLQNVLKKQNVLCYLPIPDSFVPQRDTKGKKNSIGIKSNQKKTRSYKMCALPKTPVLAGQVVLSPTHGIHAPSCIYLAVRTKSRTHGSGHNTAATLHIGGVHHSKQFQFWPSQSLHPSSIIPLYSTNQRSGHR